MAWLLISGLPVLEKIQQIHTTKPTPCLPSHLSNLGNGFPSSGQAEKYREVLWTCDPKTLEYKEFHMAEREREREQLASGTTGMDGAQSCILDRPEPTLAWPASPGCHNSCSRRCRISGGSCQFKAMLAILYMPPLSRPVPQRADLQGFHQGAFLVSSFHQV